MIEYTGRLDGKTALITGAARRIGATIATHLHGAGADVAIHYRGSGDEASDLCARLNDSRDGSALAFRADLNDLDALASMVNEVIRWQGRLDVLVNNASTFYPSPLGSITEANWADLMGPNLKAPLFLSQAAAPQLKRQGGAIVNIVDIHARRPLRDHHVYGAAKAGLAMLTRSLARDMAPEVRVNGVAPGAILWPEEGMTDAIREHIIGQIPLGRPGAPDDVAGCVLYLVGGASYVTGQVIAVDGGRSIGW